MHQGVGARCGPTNSVPRSHATVNENSRSTSKSRTPRIPRGVPMPAHRTCLPRAARSSPRSATPQLEHSGRRRGSPTCPRRRRNWQSCGLGVRSMSLSTGRRCIDPPRTTSQSLSLRTALGHREPCASRADRADGDQPGPALHCPTAADATQRVPMNSKDRRTAP
jgi:hypothetical protein